MPSLKELIDEINAKHTRQILDALAGASLHDLEEVVVGGLRAERRPSKKPRPSPKPRKKSNHEVEMDAANIVAHLKEHGPLRSEELRRALNMSREDMAKALGLALEWKAITKTGAKRATVYKAVKQRGLKPQLTLGDRLRAAAVLGK